MNRIHGHEYSGLCESCGRELVEKTIADLLDERAKKQAFVQSRITHFPMMTITQAPANADLRLICMITANVTVGTGLFNEMSQSFSDLFGATNTTSGMALKINNGEAAARAILVQKARSLGANCIFAVDVDYGTTTNNAATVNMQGTAAFIPNLPDILTEEALEKAQALESAFARSEEISRMLRGCV